jgi:hypothetical protein
MQQTLKSILAMILFLNSFHFGFSQPNRFILDTALTKLRQSHIDTIIQYTPFQGNASIVDKGMFYILYSSYLIWKKDGDVLLTKVSACLDRQWQRSFDTIFKVIRFPDMGVYESIIENLELLRKERLKPGIIKFYNGSKDTTAEIRSSHPGYTGVSVYIGSTEIENSYSYDQIYDGAILNVDGTLRAKQESINYTHNIATFIYRLTTRLSKLIEELENKNSFGN